MRSLTVQIPRAWPLAVLVSAIAFEANAFRAPDRAQLPNFDARVGAGTVTPTASQIAAAEKLRAMLPGMKVDFDELTGGAKFISGGPGFLTGANGTGKAVAPSIRPAFATDLSGPTKAFVQTQQGLFGFGAEALDKAVVIRDSITPHNGVRTMIWQQHVAGVPVFDARFVSHTTKRGELITVSSGFIPDPDKAARALNPSPADLIHAPPLPAPQAVATAAQNIGERTTADQLKIVTVQVNPGAPNYQEFVGPGLSRTAQAKLVWVPADKATLRLAWEVVLTSQSRSEMFRLLVEAQTGKVLVRHCLTAYLSEATYRVYTNDSPSPFSPGWATPNSTQPAAISRQLVTLSAANTEASPQGWIPDSANETLGNNVDAHTDTDADDLPDLPRPQGSPSRVFDFPMQLATQDPSAYRPAAVVQLFFWNNWIHDRLYELGFTEAAGNFQTDNFGRGGLGNDAVDADAQDASGLDNANFSTPVDGSAPRMQMFIWSRPNPRRDGDLDAEIVLHEYVHGLSNRHVNGGTPLTTSQSRGLGEGWSDFYALALLSQPGDDVNGCYAAGAYAGYLLGGTENTLNYYFGLRRYPYSTDQSKNPLTLNDIDPAQADHCSSGAPFHTALFQSCNGTPADEEHNQGELWCMVLWEARARLVTRHGWAAGNQLMLQLVTDGMLYSPPNPNFLQARDAILQADLANTGGANQDDLWAAFAKRGLGFSATCPSSSTVAGVHESFDLPDDLRIKPVTGFVASGPVGGPFDTASQPLTLTNFGTNLLTWTLTHDSDWLTVSSTGGTLTPGGPATRVNVALNTVASLLPAGCYTADVLLTNLTSGVGQTRAFGLRVGQADSFTELFEAYDNDLAFSTLTFTPDGSASWYRVCREPANAFPTDPSEGNVLILSDDSFAQVVLNGASVALYTNHSSIFFIGSNGYLTLKSGDETWTESLAAHFSRPRISALFHDQLPVTGTTISWKQLPDRVAVTYEGLSDILRLGLNDFQIEWFFDGRIRITYLGISNRQNLVGLSAGTGVPTGFEETNLSEAGSCDPITLTVPSNATEGDGLLVQAGRITLPIATATNVLVTLESTQPSEITVPATALVLAGQKECTFDVTVIDDTRLDGSQRAAVTASAAGFRKNSQSIEVYDNESTSLGLILPSTVEEGQVSVNGTVLASAPPTATTLVNLHSSDTNKLVVPPSIFLVAGQTSAVFTIGIIDDFMPNLARQVDITAEVRNWAGALTTITVLDNPAPVVYAPNGALISIPDTGAANLYPSVVVVSGVSGAIAKVSVLISNLTHAYPDDIGIQVVGPSGTNVVLMANAGGDAPLQGVTLSFDDFAPDLLPDDAQIRSGTYRPSPLLPGAWPPPAPAPPANSSLGAFNGTNPNGTWRLYVYDDSPGDNGQIQNGWQLTIHTAESSPPPPVISAILSGAQIQLGFQTFLNHFYHIEHASVPSASSWLTLQTIAGNGSRVSVMDNLGPGQKFYRVRVQ